MLSEHGESVRPDLVREVAVRAETRSAPTSTTSTFPWCMSVAAVASVSRGAGHAGLH
mgnify:CR=1 FL=1